MTQRYDRNVRQITTDEEIVKEMRVFVSLEDIVPSLESGLDYLVLTVRPPNGRPRTMRFNVARDWDGKDGFF